MRHLAASLCCLLAACSWVPTWGVYKIDINQGNYVTQDMVEKLKPGQTRSQVRLLLGTPLVTDAFHANRWEYLYRYEERGDVLEERRFMVAFKDDRLERWGGDPMPLSPIRGYAGEKKDGVTRSAPASDDGWWGKIRSVFGW